MYCGLASIVVMIAGSFKASTAVDGYVGYVHTCMLACITVRRVCIVRAVLVHRARVASDSQPDHERACGRNMSFSSLSLLLIAVID